MNTDMTIIYFFLAASYHWHVSRMYVTTILYVGIEMSPRIIGMFLDNSIVFPLNPFLITTKLFSVVNLADRF
jgi:hypothetical protein